MPIPDIVEILPLQRAVTSDIVVPGSKSITNRALILAALAEGKTILRGALWSEDTQVMVECLRRLGLEVAIEPDAAEPSNRTISVVGCGGILPKGGTTEQPLTLFVGNAGTAARFLCALVCLGQGVYQLEGVPRMHDRPQAGLLQALRKLGYRVETPNDRLPLLVYGAGPQPGTCQVSIEKSSQFASALLLGAPVGGWKVEVAGDNADESPYVEMTRRLVAAFPRKGGAFTIEPDASSGSYFVAADWLLRGAPSPPETSSDEIGTANASVQVRGWPASGWQMDAAFPKFLPLPSRVSRERDLGDSILTAIVLAPFAPQPVTFTELGRLRLQECERVVALRTELGKMGAQVIEKGDTLTVIPGALRGAEIETYDDHRMAMCFTILGLKVPGIKINNPACVKKTFPNFFQKLAALPPGGLGVTVRESGTGRALRLEELFAA
jgi:3-phosphoshikimate 1-carboxyvinyltransferase